MKNGYFVSRQWVLTLLLGMGMVSVFAQRSYYVVVSALTSEEEAKIDKDAYIQRGYPYTDYVFISYRNSYRVYVQSFADRGAAEKLLNEVREEWRADAWVATASAVEVPVSSERNAEGGSTPSTVGKPVYYIVVGSFFSEETAKRGEREAINRGYSQAGTVYVERASAYRIYTHGFAGRRKAEAMLSTIRENWKEDAWVAVSRDGRVPITQEEEPNPRVEPSVPTAPVGEARSYGVVISSVADYKAAEREMRRYRGRGFSGAGISYAPEVNSYRVYVRAYPDQRSAVSALAQIRQDWVADAWVTPIYEEKRVVAEQNREEEMAAVEEPQTEESNDRLPYGVAEGEAMEEEEQEWEQEPAVIPQKIMEDTAHTPERSNRSLLSLGIGAIYKKANPLFYEKSFFEGYVPTFYVRPMLLFSNSVELGLEYQRALTTDSNEYNLASLVVQFNLPLVESSLETGAFLKLGYAWGQILSSTFGLPTVDAGIHLSYYWKRFFAKLEIGYDIYVAPDGTVKTNSPWAGLGMGYMF